MLVQWVWTLSPGNAVPGSLWITPGQARRSPYQRLHVRLRQHRSPASRRWFRANELSTRKDSMIYVHSLGRAVRYYGENKQRFPSVSSGCSFVELDNRVERVAAALSRRGLRTGDRLALLLPNGLEYIELLYACSRLGVIVVPLTVDHPEKSSEYLKTPVHVRWCGTPVRRRPGRTSNGSCTIKQSLMPQTDHARKSLLSRGDLSDDLHQRNNPGEAKGVMLTTANVLSNVYSLNSWMRYRQGGMYLHAGPYFTARISRRCSPPRLLAICRLRCHVSTRGHSAKRLKKCG